LPDHVNAQMLTGARPQSTPRTYSEIVGLCADQLSKIKQVVVRHRQLVGTWGPLRQRVRVGSRVG
jgi:hypothetical protein